MKLAVEPVVSLLHGATYGTLATQSVHLPGYPYATAIPGVVDEYHRPLLLISALAEHTRNLLADPRVSLALLEPGAVNVQTAARLTLLGDAEQFEPGELLQARYLRYLPDAEPYLQLDFMFFRIIPRRIRYIAGVGRMGWLEADEITRLPVLALDRESALIESLQAVARTGVTILGVDSYGIDYRADEGRKRQTFVARDGLDEEFLHSVVLGI